MGNGVWREHGEAWRDVNMDGGWLDEPAFPDAQPDGNEGYILDLGSTVIAEKAAVEIWIPSYPQYNMGDRIGFTFSALRGQIANDAAPDVRRYLYLSDPADGQLNDHYKLLLQPLQCLPPARYEASYMVISRTNNVSLSKRVTVDVVNTPPTAGIANQMALFGQYAPGPVASWVISNGYRLAPDNVIARAVGTKQSAVNVKLDIYQIPAGELSGNQVATLTSSDGKTWTCTGDGADLVRGDMVCVQLEGESAAEIFLAAAM
jgi:hypothetical protein